MHKLAFRDNYFTVTNNATHDLKVLQIKISIVVQLKGGPIGQSPMVKFLEFLLLFQLL